MLLHETVGHAARATPLSTALIFDDRPISFAELARRVDSLAGALEQLAAPGDRIALVGDNHPAWVDAYYAVPRAGMVLCFVNHRNSPAQQAEIVRRAGATVLIGDAARLASLPGELLPTVRTRVVFGGVASGGFGDVSGAIAYDDLLAEGRPSASPLPSPDEPAWLIFTSGTTGRAKGALLTHRNVLAASITTLLERPVDPDTVYLFPFPLCHVAGYNIVLHHLARRPVLLMPRFDATGLLEASSRHHVTSMSLAPTMIRTLLDSGERSDVADALRNVRLISYGSSGIAPSLLRETAATIGAGFSQGYGMTELSGNAVFLGPEEHRRGLREPHLLTAAGRPSPLIAIDLIDDDGRPVTPGDAGEIVARGDQVMAGYVDDDGRMVDDDTIVDGWLRTGDIGRFDDEGFLHVVDRKKDIIVTGGENVASREVEDVMVAHPDVAEVAVVGVPDDRWGEMVCAVVVVRSGSDPTATELLAWGRDELGGFKQPRHVVLVDQLPRNGTGKVVKPELRAIAGRAVRTGQPADRPAAG